MKHLITIFSILITLSANADAVKTPCASEILANAVATVADGIDPFAEEADVQTQIYAVFADKDILSNVLKCPEIARANETDTIKFTPIQYEFPNGREIIINYETQPKVIKQKIDLAGKRRLPSEDPNPRIGDINDDAMWTNTNPAWYAIMITQAGALRNFVGPDKNNTVSLQYIVDNIDSLYPNGATDGGACTTRSPKGVGQGYAINRATEITTDNPDDYYYIAGNINLEWIGYAELAAEVVITIVTWGGGAAAMGVLKGARAMAAARKLSPILKTLEKSEDVKKYLSKTDELAKLADDIADAKKDANKLKQLKKRQETLENDLKALDKIDDVKNYKETSKALDDMYELLDNMGTLDKKIGKTYQKMGDLRKAYNTAKKTPAAMKYRQAIIQQKRAQQQLDSLNDAYKTLKETGHLTPDTKKINSVIDGLESQIAKKQSKLGNKKLSKKARKQQNQQIQNLQKQIKIQEAKKVPKKLGGKEQEKALKELERQIKKNEDLLKAAIVEIAALETGEATAKHIDEYKKASKDYSDVVTVGQALKAAKTARHMKQRGNVLTRAIRSSRIFRSAKAFKTAFSGGDKINKAARMGRTGSLAAKTRDWLFHSTLAAAGSLAKFEAQTGALYTIVNFAGDMFDFTDNSTSQFTNNIEFKPLLLLSASDIEGQEDVVNYGMWLMWVGDSTSAADDDAAFLMANDFAAKLHEDLTEYQKDKPDPCNVDIYVVRPILRNPGEEDGQIYYLIMNDIPWTTAD